MNGDVIFPYRNSLLLKSSIFSTIVRRFHSLLHKSARECQIDYSFWMGRVVGIDANVLTFNSDDPSSNLANVYNFSELIVVEKTKMNEKRPG